MPDTQPPRQWKPGNEHVQGKYDGVSAALTRAGYDKAYRARLLSADPAVRQAAFKEEGGFDELPPGFNLMCWERKGADPASTDNTVVLTLPEFAELPTGTAPIKANAKDYWHCTYWPYLE